MCHSKEKNKSKEQVLVNKLGYENLVFDNQELKRQLAELQRMIFGKKSERFTEPPQEQLSLFEETISSKKEEEATK
jgi:hypothetical protein